MRPAALDNNPWSPRSRETGLGDDLLWVQKRRT
jgi:hypothetical protein